MDEFTKFLQQEDAELKRIIKNAKQTLSSLEDVPEGFLQICHNRNGVQYYLVAKKEKRDRIYIRKSEVKLIKDLAQREYAKKVLKLALKYEKKINRFENKSPLDEIMQVFLKMSVDRQALIDPYISSEERFIDMWQKRNRKAIEKYGEKKIALNNQEENSLIYTDKGEQVRSKSEKIIADKLNRMAIPYCYECPLYLNGYGVVYPDFTVLNKRTRRVYYWEHLGMLEKESYIRNNVNKIETMEKNGIFPGQQLILTYEMEGHPLSTEMLQVMIRQYLL